MAVTYTLAYYDRATIKAVKKLIVQGVYVIKKFAAEIYGFL